jgi:hypothetical protein
MRYIFGRLLKNSAHLDKCATAKTVHYFKNRDKIICNKHQSGDIEPFSPVTLANRGGGKWLYSSPPQIYISFIMNNL